VDLLQARTSLIARDLLAYDGSTYQLLALPDNTKPHQTHAQQTRPLTTTPQQCLELEPTQGLSNDEQQRWSPMPKHIRSCLRDILGDESLP
jgi:hypothetical protein